MCASGHERPASISSLKSVSCRRNSALKGNHDRAIVDYNEAASILGNHFHLTIEASRGGVITTEPSLAATRQSGSIPICRSFCNRAWARQAKGTRAVACEYQQGKTIS